MYYIEAIMNETMKVEFAADFRKAKKIYNDFEEEIDPCIGDSVTMIEIDDVWLMGVIASKEYRDSGIVKFVDWTAEE